MSAEDLLVPNPDGCCHFDPNPFKKEVCKNCRRKWQEHKGVIDPAVLEGFLAQVRHAAAERDKAKAAQLEKEKAKALAKKKANQAVEDEWFFEGKDDGPDSDDDAGFRMLMAEDLTPPQLRNGSKSKPQFIVKNLIDFGECDASDLEPLSQPTGAAIPPATPPPVRSEPLEPEVPSLSPAPVPRSPQDSWDLPTTLSTRARPEYAEDLRGEIEHLRMCLAQANETKQIELDIVKDELDAKEVTIRTLTEERDTAKEKLLALEGSLAGRAEVSDVASELVLDLQALCAQTPGVAEAEARTGCRVRSMADLESELRHLHKCITKAVEAAREAQEARTAPPKPAPAHAPELVDAASAGPQANLDGTPAAAGGTATEAQKAIHAISVISAKAFTDIRISYDTQLSWIKERLSQMDRLDAGR